CPHLCCSVSKCSAYQFMWFQPSRWPGTTKLCSGEGQEILVDGVSRGEVCSKSEQEMLFHQHDDGFALLLLLKHHAESFSVSGGHRQDRILGYAPKMARPRHNFG